MNPEAEDPIEAFRRRPEQRWAVALGGIALGITLANLHWLGFVVGGALVAFPQRSVAKGLVAGAGFGVVAWTTFLVALALKGSAMAYLGMGEVTYLSVAIAIVGSVLGSSLRAIR